MSRGARNGLLAKIHVAKKQLGLDDDTYRAVLWELFAEGDRRLKAKWAKGKPSAADLGPGQLHELVGHFRDRGFTPTTPARVGREPPQQRAWKEAYLAKINAQLAEAKRPWAYAHAIAKRMWGVDRVHWLTEPEQYRGIVAALAKDARRHKRDEQ